MIEVVNIKTCPDWGKEGDFYIGRGSGYGNPFKLYHESNRVQVIAEYKKYLINNNLNIDNLVLHAKRLGCYCKPKACHGDVLAEEIEKRKRILESVINGKK